MKKYLYPILLVCFVGIISTAKAQIYIQGEGVYSFTEIANSSFLTTSNRISIEQAYTKRKEIQGVDFTTPFDKLMGEYYISNGFLIPAVCSEIEFLKKNNYRGLLHLYKVIKQGSVQLNLEDSQYLEYKDYGTHQVMISYLKTSNQLSYYAENDTYVVMGSVYCTPDKRLEAQEFIKKLAHSITFK